MHTYVFKKGTTNVSIELEIVDSTDGTPETGVVYNTSGIALEYRRDLAASTAITEVTLAALTTAHADGGFLHIGNGVYRLDLPDAACATGQDKVVVHGTVTGMVVIPCAIQLVDYDPFDTVRLGLTSLPNAVVDAAGGLPISDAGGLDLDAMNVNINDIETDTADMQPRVVAIEVDTSTTLDTKLNTAQSDLDIITGATGVNLLNATQASIDAIETDTSTTLQAELDAIQAAVITNAAGTDIAADIIAVKAETVSILADTADIQPKIGTPASDVSADIAAVKVDTAATLVDTAQIGAAGAGLTDLGGMSTGMKAEVNAEADTALTDYDAPTNTEMEARTPTATLLAYMTDHAQTAKPVTFTAGTTTTATLGNVDGSAASTTDDVYNGRVLIFNAGTLNEQATDITAYVGSTKVATITAVTTAVTSSHTAILV